MIAIIIIVVVAVVVVVDAELIHYNYAMYSAE